MRTRLTLSFSGFSSHTTRGCVTFLCLWTMCSGVQKHVLVSFTRQTPFLFLTPWKRRPNSLPAACNQAFWSLGCLISCPCSSCLPVSLSSAEFAHLCACWIPGALSCQFGLRLLAGLQNQCCAVWMCKDCVRQTDCWAVQFSLWVGSWVNLERRCLSRCSSRATLLCDMTLQSLRRASWWRTVPLLMVFSNTFVSTVPFGKGSGLSLGLVTLGDGWASRGDIFVHSGTTLGGCS